MNKSLALGFWILLSITVVGGLKCDNCYREYSNGGCRIKKTPCQLTSLQSCFRKQVFAERTFLYAETGCATNCKDVDGGKYIHHINKCCKNADFCNRQ